MLKYFPLPDIPWFEWEPIYYHGPHKWWIIADEKKTIDFIQKFNLYIIMKEGLLLTYHLSSCLSWSFILMRFCTLNWVAKILMRVISYIHAGRRFPTPGP